MDELADRNQVRPTSRYIFIDSLRGIAAIWVMLFHFYYAIGGEPALRAGPVFGWIFTVGDQGVFIFFVLSGFVISKSVEWEALSGKYFLKFLFRRSIRLDIPYWIVILLTGISVRALMLAGMSNIDAPEFRDYVLNFLYLDNLTRNSSIVAVGWTLQYEIQFYLFFILLVWIFKSVGLSIQSSFVYIYITGLVSCLYWFSWFPFNHQGLFLNYWLYFLLGVCTEWVVAKKLTERHYITVVLTVFIHFLLFLEISSLVCVATSVLLFWAGRRNALRVWLNFKWLIFAGAISYSLYLFHPFIGNRMLRFIATKFHLTGLAAWSAFFAVILITLLSCYAFFRLVEKPSLELSRKIKLKND